MVLLRFTLALTFAIIAAPTLAEEQRKDPVRQASAIADTIAARLAKLVRDVEATGADLPKIRQLTEKNQQDNERLENQIAALKQEMSAEERAQFEVYWSLKMGRSPEKLKAALEKAGKEAAEAAARVGPATVAKLQATIAQLLAEGLERVRKLRDAGGDPKKREGAWQEFLIWDAKRHQLSHAIRRDPNVADPEALLQEAETTLLPRADHAARLYRLGAHPLCEELTRALAQAEAKVKQIAALEPTFLKISSEAQLQAARRERDQLRNAAQNGGQTDLTQDEAEEVHDSAVEWLIPVLARLAALEAKAAEKWEK